MKWIIKKLFGFYKSAWDPLLPSSCIYTPSCSAYMVQQIEKRPLSGFLRGLARVLRCNPMAQGGFDPPKDSRKSKWAY